MKDWKEVLPNIEIDECETWKIRGKIMKIPPPERIPDEDLVIRPDIIDKALAAWMKLDRLPPMNFRLYGPPGGGKNSIAYSLAKILRKNIYIMKVVDAFNPEEDIACTMVMYDGVPTYVAQPLMAAMLTGNICLFDEIDKTPESALVPLSPVLDDRRTLYSTLFGSRIEAHEGFLFCAALSEEAEEGNALPEYIRQRTAPAIHVGVPDVRTLERMLRVRLPEAHDLWFQVFLKEFGTQGLLPRTSLNLLSYAFRLYLKSPEASQKISPKLVKRFLLEAKEGREQEEKEKIADLKVEREEKKKEEKNVGIPSFYQSISQETETLH